MGQSASSLPIKPLSNDYFSICSHKKHASCYLTAVGLPSKHQVHDEIKQAIASTSNKDRSVKTYSNEPNVVKYETPYDYEHNFKSSLQYKLMYTSIFSSLLKIGWRVRLASDFQRYGESSTFIFEYVGNTPNFQRPESLACISVSSHDKLQLISDMMYHQVLKSDMERILDATWKKYGHRYTCEQREHKFKNYQETIVTEYDLGESVWGRPAFSSSENGKMRLEAGMTIAHVCGQLGKASGWQFLTVGQVKGKTDYIWMVKYPNVFEPSCPALPAYGQFNLPFHEPLPPPTYAEAMNPLVNLAPINTNNAESPAIMELASYDKIRISGFPDSIINLFGQCLEAGGLQIQSRNETDFKFINNGYSFKIEGYPWWCSKEEAVRSRYALSLCMEMLRLNNYSVLTCIDISRSLSDKSAFLFVKSAVPVEALPSQYGQ